MGDAPQSDELHLREPVPEDGASLWELVQMVGLDLNSPYAYLLVGRHLAPTSTVAVFQDRVVGFVSAYRPPIHDDVLFVWQVGTHPSMRGRGLARQMILHSLGREVNQGVRWIESTVTPDNVASQRLFRSIARDLETEIDVQPYFPRELFPGEGKPELLHRIGPIHRRTDLEGRDTRMETFRRNESSVRRASRRFSAIFDRAQGHEVFDEDGRRFVDFLSGQGALNYGHNPEPVTKAAQAHLERGSVVHGLDLHTAAKRDFLDRFTADVLKRRGLDYRMMFPGPSESEAIEAAIKLARRYTGRHLIVAFTGGFHGTTLGALALSGHGQRRRTAAAIPLPHTEFMPFSNYLGDDVESLDVLERYLNDASSGLGVPAAVVVETVQMWGGVRPASFEWLGRLQELCRSREILLIVDETTTGVGRTGPFFSFEPAGIEPDLVTLGGSLSGLGLPFSLTLIRPNLDVWKPGDHASMFMGPNLAMASASAANWRDDALERDVRRKGELLRARLERAAERFELVRSVRSRGMMAGIDLAPEHAMAVSAACFDAGLLVDRCGPSEACLLLLPPLTIPDDALHQGLDLLEGSLEEVTRRFGDGP